MFCDHIKIPCYKDQEQGGVVITTILKKYKLNITKILLILCQDVENKNKKSLCDVYIITQKRPSRLTLEGYCLS